MSTPASEIGSTVVSTLYDELNKATKTIDELNKATKDITGFEYPCQKSALARMNAIKMEISKEDSGNLNKDLDNYKFKLFIFTISNEIRTFFEGKDGLLALAQAASARHPLLSPQVGTPKTNSARQALMSDLLDAEVLKKKILF